jgi:Zn-dependent peptidase ImmA (M78 family)
MRVIRPHIADLAEFIAEENNSNGLILPQTIADKKDISYTYGNYGDSYVGLLEHSDNQFHIYLNSVKIKPLPHPRTRFTFAHELGHFFIDEHRRLLQKGISLSFSDRWSIEALNPVEQEANQFASHLLIPRFLALPVMHKNARGMQSLLALNKKLKTSISCTASQLVQYADYPCAVLFFSSNKHFLRRFYSTAFEELFGTAALKIEHDRIAQLFEEAKTSPHGTIADEICFAYNWFNDLYPSKKSMPLYQQLVKQGDFGYLLFIHTLDN